MRDLLLDSSLLEKQITDLLQQVPAWQGIRFSDLRNFKPMGGGTNKGYYFENVHGRFVLRISGENAVHIGINRPAEFEALARASAAGLAPEIMHFYCPEGHLLTRWLDGVVLDWPDMPKAEILPQVADVLRRVHCLEPTGYDFSPMSDINHRIARSRELGLNLQGNAQQHVDQAQRICTRLWCNPVRDRGLCHGDAYANNCMLSPKGLILIDWEFAGMGDIFYDISAASISCPAEQVQEFLHLYFGEQRDDAMEKLHAIRYVSWVWNWTWAVLQLHFWNNDAAHVEAEEGLYRAMQQHLEKW